MTLLRQIVQRSRNTLLYAAVMAVLIFTLKWLQWKYLITDSSTEIYAGLIAVLFTSLGLWLATRLVKSKIQTVVVEKEVYITHGQASMNDVIEKLNLTTREAEVLHLLIQGRSNAEIADHLFLSVSTVKTHVSNLFAKMEVKSRTQAIQKANQLRLIR